MANSFDVAVVGGGVIGSAIAYQLARRGRRVVLLERGRLGAKASSAAAGMLGAQAEMAEEGPLLRLALESRARFPRLAEELKDLSGTDIRLIDRGMYKIAMSDKEAEELRQLAGRQCGMGLEVAWLDGERLREREPALSPKVRGAVFLPRDGQVSAPELALAFAKSAAVLGADIREHTDVTGFLVEGGKVRGLRTQTGVIHCGRLVVAAGAWSGGLLERLGISLPMVPVKGECFSVITHRPLLTRTVFSHGCYLVPKAGGRLVVGATMESGTFDERVSLGTLSELMQKAMRVLPAIHFAEWERTWSGIRPQTADGLPYIGRHPDDENVIIATGHFRNGILLSPVTGELVADLAEGKPDHPLLEAFRIDRAKGGEVSA
jgi:glycine oxidase